MGPFDGDSARFERSPRRRYYTGRNPGRVQSIDDLRARTHKLMPMFVLEYLEGGAGEEATLRREREAYAEWRFMPLTLTDVSERDVSAPIIGRRASMPLLIAPTGLNGLFMRHADLALAKGAAGAGVPFIQSTMSNDEMERVAQVPGLRHWWQLYVFGPEEIWQSLVDRAEAAGCEALVLTTNAQIFGQRHWDERGRSASGFPTIPALFDAAFHPRWLATTLRGGLPEFVNVTRYLPTDRRSFFKAADWIREQMPRSLSWSHVAKIRDRWRGPFFLKGLLNLEEVSRALDSGVDGIMLGGHGGRQADWAVSALDLLPAAREIVAGRMNLYISGGIRSGTDILKAKALGADAVLAGRAVLYGLCAYGEEGVRCAIDTLRSEMTNEMGQYGARRLDQLSARLLIRACELPLGPSRPSTSSTVRPT